MNDDMDDLFRKASDEYPLKESGADWDKIAQALQNAGSDKTTAPATKQNDRKKLLWLLLLLPFAWICTQYKGDNTTQQATAIAQPATIEKAKDQQPINIDNNNKATDNTQNNLTASPTNSADHSNASSEFSLVNNDHHVLNSRTSNNKENKKQVLALGNNDNQQEVNNKQEVVVNNTSKDAGGTTTNADNTRTQENKQESNLVTTGTEVTGKTNEPIDSASLMKNSVAKKDDVKKDSTGNSDKKNIVLNKKQTKERGFYAGLNGALDVSTIKMQQVKKAGFGVGVIVGYQFNKHWSVESGLQWDKKEYYSDGEYFDKTKTTIPTYVTIVNVTGNCNMFEIPLNVHYNFDFTKKGNFFASAGMSSYLMKKENYAYWAKTTGPAYYGERSYNNSGNNWFSILNLSAGYEYKLGKIGNFRIEPYLKIPVKGVGIGSLPITSVGLNVGIIHHFK